MEDITLNISEIYRRCKKSFEYTMPALISILCKIGHYLIIGFQIKIMMIHSNYIYIIMFCEISYSLTSNRIFKINNLLDRLSVVLIWSFLFYLAFYRDELINIIGRLF